MSTPSTTRPAFSRWPTSRLVFSLSSTGTVWDLQLLSGYSILVLSLPPVLAIRALHRHTPSCRRGIRCLFQSVDSTFWHFVIVASLRVCVLCPVFLARVRSRSPVPTRPVSATTPLPWHAYSLRCPPTDSSCHRRVTATAFTSTADAFLFVEYGRQLQPSHVVWRKRPAPQLLYRRGFISISRWPRTATGKQPTAFAAHAPNHPLRQWRR